MVLIHTHVVYTRGNDESKRVCRLSEEDNWSGVRNVYI